MKHLTIIALVGVALLAGVTGMLRSRLPSSNAGTAPMPTIHELQSAAPVDKLPVDDFEDRSLVFPRELKR